MFVFLYLIRLLSGTDKYVLHPTKIDRITGYFLDGPPDVPTARFQILFAVDQSGDYCIFNIRLPEN